MNVMKGPLLLLAPAAAILGWYLNLYLLLAFGGVGCGLCLFTFGVRRRSQARVAAAASANPLDDSGTAAPTVRTESELVHRMIEQKRYALLLRLELFEQLEEQMIDGVLAQLEQEMSLVPSGQVVVGDVDELLDEGKIDIESLAEEFARVVDVPPVFLDRHAVSNADYYKFVHGGGYEEMAIWDETIWPAVLDFVDRTGHPGPRLWSDGRYPAGEEDLPVVGVCWYETAAYARWVGKRLPTDAAWVKAGAWPVAMKAGVWVQRKYPWGPAFDGARANLWISGKGKPVAVDEYEAGVSVGGVYQLIGNVWEWTASNFGRAADHSLTLPVPMRSIRGGAFDTYFETQATCHFQSGENPLARKHNIGFRLALPVADLSPRVAQRLFGGANTASERLEETPA